MISWQQAAAKTVGINRQLGLLRQPLQRLLGVIPVRPAAGDDQRPLCLAQQCRRPINQSVVGSLAAAIYLGPLDLRFLDAVHEYIDPGIEERRTWCASQRFRPAIGDFDVKASGIMDRHGLFGYGAEQRDVVHLLQAALAPAVVGSTTTDYQ